MANMIPRVISDENPSDGEKHLFHKLQQDEGASSWHILHSLNIAHHKTQVMGEIDFLIFIPKVCIFAIEVKAHRFVKYSDGKWFLGKSSVGSTKGPFKQINDSIFSLVEYLKTKNDNLSKIPIFPLVLFTHTELVNESIEWHVCEFCGAREYRKYPISSILLRRAKFFKNRLKENQHPELHGVFSNRPSDTDVSSLIKVLRPEIEPIGNILPKSIQIKSELETFTNEQFLALDAMADNRRVVFKGPAGVGKTTLAIEAANRATKNGFKVLFLCKNRLLAQELKHKFTDFHVCTITELLESQVSDSFKNAESRATDDYWGVHLPIECYERICDNEWLNCPFNYLVVDEAQDILANENWLDCIELFFDGGFSSGHWNIFGDFDFQDLYSLFNKSRVLENFGTRVLGFPTFKLSTNCRNLKPVSSLNFSLSSLEVPYSKYLRVNNPIPESRYYFYNSTSEMLKQLQDQVAFILKQGFTRADIVVLSKLAESKSTCYLHSSSLEFKPFSFQKDDVQFTSIHKFKGLEAPIIILVDFDEIQSEAAKKMLYTGASRATESVIYLFHKKIKNYLIAN